MKKYSQEKEQLMIEGSGLLQSFYQTKVRFIRYLGGGSYGRVFLFNIEKPPYQVVLKACLLKDMADKEVQAIETLRSQSLIPMVDIYHVFHQTEDVSCDYILMAFIDGKNALFSLRLLLAHSKKKRAFAKKVIDNLAAYHQKKHATFGPIEQPNYKQWLDYYFPFVDNVLTQAKDAYSMGKLEKNILDLILEANTFRDIIFEEPILQASLIHGDYNVANIMVDQLGVPTTIIDPLHTMWADKEYDLFQLRNLTGECFHLYDTYKQNYPTSKRVDIKCAFYALYHELYVIFESGHRYNLILMPLVKRLRKELKKLKNERNTLKNDEFIA